NSNNNNNNNNNEGNETPKSYTYNSYVTISPSNWNELTYQDNNDTTVMQWLGSSFFGFDFKYDANGEIIPGEYEIVFEAATALEDVSGSVDAKWGIPEGAKNRAWKITLRNDLKWENGDPIKAEDFVYTMKEQLNPDFQNYRADSYYNSAQSLIGAKNYAKQGQEGIFAATTVYSEYSADLDSSLIFTLSAPNSTYLEECAMRTLMGFPASYNAAKCAAYIVGNYLAPNPGSKYDPESGITEEEYNELKATYDGWINNLAAMEGKTLAEIKADESLAATWADLIGWWQTEPNEELHFFVAEGQFPEFDWENVGIYAPSEYEIVIVLTKALDLLKEDGTLSYKAAYNMSSLPLVHKATYEANKVAPDTANGETLWTSTYNSSVETTMSWGPYKLTSFQTGMQFTLDKNDNWYGYGVEENEGLYQTTKIVYDVVKDWNAAWILFQAGKLDGIGIDVSIAEDYKNSDQAFFTPDDYVGSLQLQSSKEALAAREEDGINKTILSYTDFRKAISLSIDRADFTAKCTTSSKAGFGLFNSMHYYDVANGGVFRNTDEAKKVLCEIYAIDYTDTAMYPTLDDAVAAISGYNLTEAAKLYTSAYEAALAAGDISATDKVKLTFGTGAINDVVQRRFDYLVAALTKAVEGTPLEGRIELELKDFNTAWANDFRAGAYDICMGGWTGAAWDPGYFLLAYLDKGYMYSAAWDTKSVQMTFTMVGVGENGEDITETMSLTEWYDCLNGNSSAKYDWSSAALHESQRLQLIAALEKEVLKVYYTVPLENSFSASLISYQCDYITYEYNTFMGYGGVKYMTYNFDDAAWAAEVARQGNELDYR
ncbi:MAG: hypothetical protein IKW53_00215, partial [Clostridia bacterium]|nr:hypothetical protein [Clostridia bacterium]